MIKEIEFATVWTRNKQVIEEGGDNDLKTQAITEKGRLLLLSFNGQRSSEASEQGCRIEATKSRREKLVST